MTQPDSSSPHRDGGLSRPASGDRLDAVPDLPDDLLALDRSLEALLAPSGRQQDDAAMVDRILAATAGDLPDRVLPFDASRIDHGLRFRRLVAGAGAVAAAVAVAMFAGRMLSGPATSTSSDDAPGEIPRLADGSRIESAVDPLQALDVLETRDSEVMLVAVLDPAEDWFDDDAFAELDAESVLRSRAFGLDDLEGSVFAMLGGPTS